MDLLPPFPGAPSALIMEQYAPHRYRSSCPPPPHPEGAILVTREYDTKMYWEGNCPEQKHEDRK